MSTETANKPAVNPEAYNIRWGSDAFRVRVISAERKNSSKGNPMLNFSVEIFGANPRKNDNGEMVDINGLQVFGRQMLMPDKGLKYINAQRNSLGLPDVTASEVTSIEAADYLQKEGAAIIESSLEERKNDVTGEVVVNPLTGKPVMDIKREIKEWLTR